MDKEGNISLNKNVDATTAQDAIKSFMASSVWIHVFIPVDKESSLYTQQDAPKNARRVGKHHVLHHNAFELQCTQCICSALCRIMMTRIFGVEDRILRLGSRNS